MGMIEHKPQGDPCAKCGQPASKHRASRRRPRHAYSLGCCDAEENSHPTREQIEARRVYDEQRGSDRQQKRFVVGIDGEGATLHDGKHAFNCTGKTKEGTPCPGCLTHVYTYLCAVREDGEILAQTEYKPTGLSHEDCAAMLLSLPRRATCFMFMNNYDITMWLRDMPKEDVYLLLRPELRETWWCRECAKTKSHNPYHKQGGPCPNCNSPLGTKRADIKWKRRAYDAFNTVFTIKGPWEKRNGKVYRDQTTIWDGFKFFQCSFVKAIERWKVGTEEEQKTIAAMKERRSDFESESPDDVMRYCQLECRLLAVMMRKVIQAHENAGYPLKAYHGPGSTASAMMKKHGVAHHRNPPLEELHPELANAICSSFFGGHIEVSRIGIIRCQTGIHQYDIASAYPYVQTFLPCLACGTWRKLRQRNDRLRQSLANAQVGIGRFHVRQLRPHERKELAWAPLPFRDPKGSIVYGTNFTGWAYWDELEAALEGWPDLVQLTGEAWVYHTDCDHKPFEYLPAMFKRRVEVGKNTGEGIVLKLGPSSNYGKCAQSKGAKMGKRPPFQDWCWAGLTTSGTRAQNLRAICSARDRWNILSIATDGILSLEALDLERPRPTNTGGLKDEKGNAMPALGEWEHDVVKDGMFLGKPGLYWKLNVDDFDKVKARGIGRKLAFNENQRIMRGFLDWDRADQNYHVPLRMKRFFGARTSLHPRCFCKNFHAWYGRFGACPRCGGEVEAFNVSDTERMPYGTWDDMPVELRFNVLPKREPNIPKGGENAMLCVRDLGGATSAAYDAIPKAEGLEAEIQRAMVQEQPDLVVEDE